MRIVIPKPAKTSVSPRSSPIGTFRASPSAKSEEKRMFSQAVLFQNTLRSIQRTFSDVFADVAGWDRPYTETNEIIAPQLVAGVGLQVLIFILDASKTFTEWPTYG